MMSVRPFLIERFFARYEFSEPYMLSASHCEPVKQQDLLAMADAETRHLWESLSLTYTESAGHPLLRTEIAHLYQGLRAEDVLVITPEEGIFIAMHTLLHPGDHVVSIFPAYQSLYEIARSRGCSLSYWKPAFDGTWKFRVSDLEALITDKTRMLVVNFPHNPTGAHLSREAYMTLVEIARKHNLILFSDEMYRYLEYDPENRLPSGCEVYEKAITLCGLSKSFGLPGLRIGWLATRNRQWLESFYQYRDYTTICNSAPSEILAIIALRAKEQLWQQALKIISGNLQLLESFFSRNEETLIWAPPQAGPVSFSGFKKPMNMENFSIRLARKYGIILLPSNAFEMNTAHFRIGFGRKDFPVALVRFEKALAKEKER